MKRVLIHAAAVAVAIQITLVMGLAAVASTQLPGPPQEHPIAIVNATLHPVASPTIESGVILFDEGRIVGVGPNIELPDEVERIDGEGKHVFPGLFCAGGQLGLSEVNSVRATQDASETGSLNPNVKVQVAVNPDSELIPVTRTNGVLLTLTMPKGGLISGTAAVLQLDGWTWEDMTLKAPAGMHVMWPRLRSRASGRSKASKGDSAGESSDPLQPLIDVFQHAQQYRRGRKGDAVDVRYESLLKVLDRSVPLIVSADTQRQIESAVAFATRRNLRLILYGGYDAESCAPLLREHDVPVIIPAVYRLPQRRSDPFDAAYTLPERLHRAGLRFCIAGVDRFNAPNLRNLPYHAATAVAYGLPWDEAIRAITLSPAEILGVDRRVGSLEVGKDATLIVTDGDPLETPTQVHIAYIQGRRVDLGNRQRTLWQKYREKYRRIGATDSTQGAK